MSRTPLRRKVLLVTSEFPPGPGGIGSHAYSLVNSLSLRGFDVHVAAVTHYVTDEQAFNFDKNSHSDVYVVRLFNQGAISHLLRMRILRRMVRDNSYDVVLLSGLFSLWAGMILKWLYPSLHTMAILHGSEVNPGSWPVRLITHQAIAQANRLLPVSRFTFGLLPQRLRQRPYTIIPNGIEPERMPPVKAYSLENLDGSPILLTVGNVTPRKGQHRVIKALPALVESFPEVRYHVVGLPTHVDSFGSLARQLKVDHLVRFHGHLKNRADLGGIYASSTVFVILSENQPDGNVEGFGIVVLEANYYGIPVIGAKGCGIESAIKDGFNGRLVDGDQPDEVKQALIDILENYDLYCRQAKEWAMQHDWKQISATFEQLINTVGSQK